MCLYPKRMRNPRYKPNKSNGGIVPPVSDKRLKWILVGCERCMMCKKKKASEWRVRLSEELKMRKNGVFVTLTLSDKSFARLELDIILEHKKDDIKPPKGYKMDDAVAALAIKRFSGRWAKRFKKRPTRWLCTEIGQKKTERLHLHGIIFEDQHDAIEDRWSYGNVYLGYKVDMQCINYIVKYIYKVDEKHKNYKGRVFCSPGIGKNYFNSFNARMNSYNGDKTRDYYRLADGRKLALPKYYRRKIYNDEERELLTLKSLDEGVIWINGSKAEIERKDYIDRLYVQERAKNIAWGYGTDKVDKADKERYEKKRRVEAYKRLKKLTSN